jgi:hypothetical protein
LDPDQHLGPVPAVKFQKENLMIDQIKQEQLTLLARKALLQDELKNIDAALGQFAAILQYAEQSAPKDPEGPSQPE